jgi:ABC transporter with metal-binding/Fe-S-binding domain ATP-binding protein
MDLAALVSGGKDSVFALYKAQKLGHNIKVLVTMIPKRSDSYMFHFPNIDLTKYISKALEIPIITRKTSGVKEKELEDLKLLLSSLEIDGVVTGAIASSYQKKRIDKICKELGLKSISPLWHQEPIEIMRELLDLKFKIIIVGIFAFGLDKSWLGKEITNERLKKLIELNKKYQISLVGEGGEYESFVLDAPFFKKSIKVINSETNLDKDSGVFEIKEVTLVDKN